MAILRSQIHNNDCGPTCFANTLNILGYDIKIEQANKICGLQREGTDSDDLIKAFDRYGFEGREKVYYGSSGAWNWLTKNTNRGIPITILSDNGEHWLLVLLAGKSKAQIIDPEDGLPTIISRKNLIERWKCISSKYSKHKFYSLEIIPYKKKSIKAVMTREELIKTMDIK